MALTKAFYDKLDEIIEKVGIQHISYDDRVVQVTKLDGSKLILSVDEVFDYSLEQDCQD